MEQKIKFILKVTFKSGTEETVEWTANSPTYEEITDMELVKIELVNILRKEKLVQVITNKDI